MYKDYSDDDIIANAAKVKSIAGLLRSLGKKPAGGNYANMKRKLQQLEVDTSHWTGQGWNKGEQLKDWSQYKRGERLKPHLIRERGHECELCVQSIWMGEPIMLEVHHVDGDRTNNNLENLELLCPNCHSLTDNWRGKKHRSMPRTGFEPA